MKFRLKQTNTLFYRATILYVFIVCFFVYSTSKKTLRKAKISILKTIDKLMKKEYNSILLWIQQISRLRAKNGGFSNEKSSFNHRRGNSIHG